MDRTRAQGLRGQAERSRRLAKSVTDEDTVRRLLDVARDFEAQAERVPRRQRETLQPEVKVRSRPAAGHSPCSATRTSEPPPIKEPPEPIPVPRPERPPPTRQ